MRLCTFLAAGDDEPRAGEVRGDEVVAYTSGSVVDRLAGAAPEPADGPSFALADVTLLAPVPRPRAIFGIGLNYAAHAAEQGRELPDRPIVFMKLPRSSVPGSGPVRRPRVVERMDYEAELVVVIGAGGRIAGWAVGDDVSARDLQRAEPQWTRAKGFDTSCPWGPWITTVDELPDAGRPAHPLMGQRRAAPGLDHRRPDLRSPGGGRLHRRDDHARAGGHRPHRHPAGRR